MVDARRSERCQIGFADMCMRSVTSRAQQDFRILALEKHRASIDLKPDARRIDCIEKTHGVLCRHHEPASVMSRVRLKRKRRSLRCKYRSDPPEKIDCDTSRI